MRVWRASSIGIKRRVSWRVDKAEWGGDRSRLRHSGDASKSAASERPLHDRTYVRRLQLPALVAPRAKRLHAHEARDRAAKRVGYVGARQRIAFAEGEVPPAHCWIRARCELVLALREYTTRAGATRIHSRARSGL
jgi:hypothetical protein